jgi:hypothetical protein
LVECFRCGKVSESVGACRLCGSLSIHAPELGDTAGAYSLAGADQLDVLTRADVVVAGLSVTISPTGSAYAYEWHGNGPVFVLAYGKAREAINGAGIETVGDVVRLALADWHTWGGRVDVLPRKVGKYSVTFSGYFDAAQGVPASVVSFDAGVRS